jgi:hypothetical protein
MAQAFCLMFLLIDTKDEKTMKKWGLGLMLVAMLATPMLACGFPLPAGTSMMAVTKTVCADGESADSCQLRQDAYQMMAKLNSVVVEDLNMNLTINEGEDITEMQMTGMYEYVVNEAEEGLGANLHAKIEEGAMVSPEETESLSGAEFIIVDNRGYTSRDGGETWTVEELDADALQGVGMLLGIAGVEGASLDLFSDPAIFTVTALDDVEIDGQMMKVQKLEVNLQSLLMDADALGALLESGSQVGGDAVSTDELGDPAEIAMMSAMLIPFLTGTEFSSTLYIGADDGLVHKVEQNYVFKMDLSAFDPETPPMEMSYVLSGLITNHNSDIVIEAPEGAVEGEGLLGGGGLFGGESDLGSSLFGQ